MRLLARWMVLSALLLLMITTVPAHGANATVSDCVNFTGPGTISEAVTAANSFGGIIDFSCSGTITFTSELHISDNVIMDGGGVVTLSGGGTTRILVVDAGITFTLYNITLASGNATEGGAIYVNGSFSTDNVTFSGNHASLNGGAILNSGTSSIHNSKFIGNTAVQSGGAIAANSGVAVIRSTFYSNTAANGAAILTNTLVSIRNNIFYSNTATTAGAGVVQSNGSTLTINHNTFLNNTSAAVTAAGGNVVLHNSIISGVGVQCTSSGGTLTVHPTNYSNVACGGATVVSDLMLGSYDGTIVPILVGSPAQDAVVCGSVVDDRLSTSRPQGSACDAGAHELIAATNIALDATASCVGDNLEVNIIAGDPNFQITATSGTLMTGITTTGLVTIYGPLNETKVNVTELGGDTENFPLGDFNCVASTTLSASAVCVGKDLYVTIANGDTPFQITASSGTLATGLGIGTHVITGPVSETGVNVTELAGDTENFALGNLTCVATSTPSTSATPAVLGCALDSTDGVDVANAPDNTYCRVLMKNGGVVSYSGAIPADLIGLGVILGVDVYRLEGGQTINTFPDYARICLQGSGRYFYMDGRNAPRYAVEMPTESVDGMTCAWIPAPGTVILTN